MESLIVLLKEKVATTVKKYREEGGKFFATFWNPPPATHFFGRLPNRFVEASRVSPYIAGHLMLLQDLAILILLGALLWA